MPVGPVLARETVDRLEATILDPERARRAGAAEDTASDETAAVPGSPEPPD